MATKQLRQRFEEEARELENLEEQEAVGETV